jgi:hypothetical protein
MFHSFGGGGGWGNLDIYFILDLGIFAASWSLVIELVALLRAVGLDIYTAKKLD